MKSKIMILSLLFAGACATANAQDAKDNYYTQKWTDNIYIGAGIGVVYAYNNISEYFFLVFHLTSPSDDSCIILRQIIVLCFW